MQLFVQGGSKFEYQSTPELTEYTELTFRDWGFHTESFTKQSWNIATPITSWNNIAISGILKFEEINSTIVIGADQQSSSWKGIKLEYYLDGTNTLWFGKNGTSTAKAISGIDVNKEYDFRITFHETDDGTQVTLAINNKTHKLTVDSLAGFDIVVDASFEVVSAIPKCFCITLIALTIFPKLILLSSTVTPNDFCSSFILEASLISLCISVLVPP